ncbi:MAG TPA: hypothetical protein VMF58_07820 [Rhizomicrobium sp.]|nr:hypothetical protein [Rhizomicrobium sp.]
MIGKSVKLVIWDLDETFWKGTLSEGGISPIARNHDMVVTLCKRGIISSICSKNDFEQTKAKLIELGMWDYFVFPHISFSPKGKAIAEMIEGAALRAENVLFIDDNPSNLEEVKFFNPEIMTAHPDDVLEGLLDDPHLKGKNDPEMTRLKQYRFLQQKVEERSASTLSNEEFLRASNIRVRIDYDIDANFDRVVELINRTNQLNYTKKRLETPEDIAEFRKELTMYAHVAGCVFAQDNYGDYGLIGFFLMKKKAAYRRLIHFAFSCRTMHMGVEQYVYEMLERPDLEIAQPVSYGLSEHTGIDWINTGGGEDAASAKKVGKLLLLGGCDLLQLASYCSANRVEFVNRMDGELKVRYDDPFFIVGDRKAIEKHADVLPLWSLKDVREFDDAVATSDLIILCMWSGMQARFFDIGGEIQVRLTTRWARYLKRTNLRGFSDNAEEIELSEEERWALMERSFDTVDKKSRGSARIILIGATGESGRGRREAFNQACEQYCAVHPKFRFVDVNTLLSDDMKAHGRTRHYSPAGYYQMAQHILDMCAAADAPSDTAAQDEVAHDAAAKPRLKATAV